MSKIAEFENGNYPNCLIPNRTFEFALIIVVFLSDHKKWHLKFFPGMRNERMTYILIREMKSASNFLQRYFILLCLNDNY